MKAKKKRPPAGKLPRWTEYMPIASLKPDPRNPKAHASLAASFARYGFVEPPVIDERTGLLVAGHGRLEELQAQQAAGAEPPEGVIERAGDWWVLVGRGWSSKDDDHAEEYLAASNLLGPLGGWKDLLLRPIIERAIERKAPVEQLGITQEIIARVLGDRQEAAASVEAGPSLRDRFLVPPFSVLDARQGYWQDRKRAWLALGIKSEIGRGENLLKMSDTVLQPDPVKRAAMKKTRRLASPGKGKDLLKAGAVGDRAFGAKGKLKK